MILNVLSIQITSQISPTINGNLQNILMVNKISIITMGSPKSAVKDMLKTNWDLKSSDVTYELT